MRYKKFLLIPVLFFLIVWLYASFIGLLGDNTATTREASNIEKSSGGEIIGVGQAVSVQVTRATKPYLFGFVNLPVYIQGIGNLSVLHTVFFWSLYISTIFLTTIFVIIERRNVDIAKINSKLVFKQPNIWMKLAKAIGIGALFSIVSFLVSGDASSLPLGLLVAYLEFRLS